jgi:hypothetical protein
MYINAVASTIERDVHVVRLPPFAQQVLLFGCRFARNVDARCANKYQFINDAIAKDNVSYDDAAIAIYDIIFDYQKYNVIFND